MSYYRVATLILILHAGFGAIAYGEDGWFKQFKATATDAELYSLLYSMPKGGDLHNHLSGAAFAEWWYELALQQKSRGFEYYTRVRINNCRGYGSNEFGDDPYLIYFRNIQGSNYEKLSECEKSEYVKLQDMTPEQKQGWLNSLVIDQPHEGRNEFFERHWQRINDLYMNHEIMAEILVRNMQAFGKEGLSYLEIDVPAEGVTADGQLIDPETVYQYYQQRLQKKDALDTGVTVRFHYALLRFSPFAEQNLEDIYRFVDAHRERYVALDLAGREDNDKGHPQRFLPVLRQMRSQYPDIELSIHAGEVDEPNRHIRDTLLLGANRIGHGVNLLSDPDTLLLMRHGPYLVEINLVSNLLLEYVSEYNQHPFPEYLRLEVPVALSTDDRGMWDSNMTDEFFVAVKEFNLSWDEIKKLSRNSIAYGFMEAEVKQQLLQHFDQRIEKFEQEIKSKGAKRFTDKKPKTRGFICERYQMCNS